MSRARCAQPNTKDSAEVSWVVEPTWTARILEPAFQRSCRIGYPWVMPHVFEPASSGRAKCRGCGNQIEKGTLRFGERIPNPYAEGETTLWFHPVCAAYKRPEAMLETLEQEKGNV